MPFRRSFVLHFQFSVDYGPHGVLSPAFRFHKAVSAGHAQGFPCELILVDWWIEGDGRDGVLQDGTELPFAGNWIGCAAVRSDLPLRWEPDTRRNFFGRYCESASRASLRLLIWPLMTI